MRQRVGMSRRDDLDIVVVCCCCCCCGLATLHWCYQLRRRIDDFDLVIMVDNGRLAPPFCPIVPLKGYRKNFSFLRLCLDLSPFSLLGIRHLQCSLCSIELMRSDKI
jgi:hypothetical protein